MSITFTTYNLKSSGRHSIRSEVVDLFKNELPGSGTGDLSSKYIYLVDSFMDYNVLLKRPAPLNKGFDFIVSIETPDNQRIFPSKSGMKMLMNPSHKNISDILLEVKQANEKIYFEKILPIIENIYLGENITFNSQKPIAFFYDRNNKKHPVEIILLSIKWLFIEQDITYWNWSGRSMLYSHLDENNLL